MAGGYDPNETGTFPGGDETSDKTPLTTHEEEEEGMGMKQHGSLPSWKKKGYHFPSITKTNTSGSHETSFVDTPSGGLLFVSRREQEKPEVEERIKDVYQNPNLKKFFSYKGDFDRIVIKLTRKDAKEYHLDNPSEFPKTLREALGKTREEVNQEEYEKQQEEERKQEERKKKHEEARKKEEGNKEELRDAEERLSNLRGVLREQKKAKNNIETTEEADEHDKKIRKTQITVNEVEKEVNELIENGNRLERATLDAEARVEEGERQVETARERVNERLLSLRDRIKEIFKKHGFTVVAVATAIATVIGVIVSNLKAGLTKVAKGVGDGMKALGKKLGEILPGMIGAIASFIFRTAGEVIGFLAKNAWLLIVGLVVLAVERFKKKGK